MMTNLSLLSEDAPPLARDAGFGYRFRYWRGASGRRYLFSAVPSEALADFRSVVVIYAEPVAEGRLRARALFIIAANGQADGAMPKRVPGDKAFVHFLAPSDAERAGLVDDLAAVPLRLAA